MMRGIVLLFLFALLVISRIAQGQQQPDKDEEGPGAFYFAEYEQEPWRLVSSKLELLKKSAGLAAGSVLVFSYLSARKNRT